MARKRRTCRRRSVQGGRIIGNDNLTIVRGAKLGKRDLPAKKTVKGSKVAMNDNLTLARATARGIRTN